MCSSDLADANPNGDIFGGWLLSQMDLAGGNLASQRARGRVATVAITAMTFNFVLNNELTYADKRLRGFFPLARGWLKFAATCAFGMLANIGVSTALVRVGFHPISAALVGIVRATGGEVFNAATPEALAREVLQWLDAPERMAAVQQRFAELHQQLRRDTAQLATDAIEKVLAR